MTSTWATFLTPAHATGFLAVVIGAVDAWAFRASFGLEWDKGLVIGGLSFLGGATFPAVAPVVAAAVAKLQSPPGSTP